MGGQCYININVSKSRRIQKRKEGKLEIGSGGTSPAKDP